MSRPSNPVPRRSPPPPPVSSSSETSRSTDSNPSRGGVRGAALGAFWSTEHAKDTLVPEDRGAPTIDDESPTLKKDRSRSEKHCLPGNGPSVQRNSQVNPMKSGSAATFENEAFNTFVAEFDTAKLSPTTISSGKKLEQENSLEAEIDRLQEQLKQANADKAEITAKYEKLAAICRSQRQELQELKQALAAKTPSPKKDSARNQSSTNNQAATSQRAKPEGTVRELQQGMFDKNLKSSEAKPWQAFANESNTPTSVADHPKSVRTRNGHSSGSTKDSWGFGNDNFTASPAAISRTSKPSEGNTSQRFGDSNKLASKTTTSQPAGWAGF